MKITPTASIIDMLCIEKNPEPCGVVIFGASGDLTRRKLLPALFNLFRRKLLPPSFFLLGFARSPNTDESFRRDVQESLPRTGEDGEAAARFASCCYYLPGDYKDPALYRTLAAQLALRDAQAGTRGNLLFYLSTPPDLYLPIVTRLGDAGLLQENNGWRRVVFEKPFGNNLATARELDQGLTRVLAEEQVYRIDHYLGKETVQNIFILRFANLIFEPLWSRQYIESVQITAAETLGVEHRGGYFDQAGLLRDMFQNHMLQLLTLTAMEPPSSFDSRPVLSEKTKVLRALRPFEDRDDLRHRLVRGQYRAAVQPSGTRLDGYTDEPGIPPASVTETFVAGTFFIDNWRWNGVPFFLRSGKRLPRRLSEIVITFKPVPFSIFQPLKPEHLARNVLVLNIQPDEGMELTVQAKQPGPKLCMSALTMDVKYRDVFKADPPDAYQRLLLDCMLGDQTLFNRADFNELAWNFLMPVLDAWGDPAAPVDLPLHGYPAGSWGPPAADDLAAAHGGVWHNP